MASHYPQVKSEVPNQAEGLVDKAGRDERSHGGISSIRTRMSSCASRRISSRLQVRLIRLPASDHRQPVHQSYDGRYLTDFIVHNALRRR